MVGPARPVRTSFAEYLELEEATLGKHEFLDGQIFAVAGGSPEHSALTASLVTQLSVQLRGGRCRVHASELRIRVLATGLATYPDVSVVCGPWERDPESPRTVVNPTLVVEVLSPSTEAYDRGEKLLAYKQIPSLSGMVLVAHDRRELEVWTREGAESAWGRRLFGPGEVAHLAQPTASIDVDAVYDDAAEPGP